MSLPKILAAAGAAGAAGATAFAAVLALIFAFISAAVLITSILASATSTSLSAFSSFFFLIDLFILVNQIADKFFFVFLTFTLAFASIFSAFNFFTLI